MRCKRRATVAGLPYPRTYILRFCHHLARTRHRPLRFPPSLSPPPTTTQTHPPFLPAPDISARYPAPRSAIAVFLTHSSRPRVSRRTDMLRRCASDLTRVRMSWREAEVSTRVENVGNHAHRSLASSRRVVSRRDEDRGCRMKIRRRARRARYGDVSQRHHDASMPLDAPPRRPSTCLDRHPYQLLSPDGLKTRQRAPSMCERSDDATAGEDLRA
ncbi:hypothetical protein C8Q80DRAFT_1202022 [Daedaleopsis nitida]|nr:hypothetical protein C8Q80DRAFT_1202022 [Daedaleopsis nitida]